MRKLTYWLVGLVLIGVAIGAVLLLNNIQEITWQAAENAVCEATVADQGGVDINSAFHFIFEDDVSANAVRRFLTVEPAVEFNYHRGLQGREVLAVPLEPLQPGTLYHFRLTTERESLSWAFQTKREWLVEYSRPAYTDTAVSPGAALELYFNQSLTVDLAAIEEYVLISPSIAGHYEQFANCLRFVPDEPWVAATVYTARISAGLPALGSDITLAGDYTVAFETEGGDIGSGQTERLWRVEGNNQIFLPGQTPVFSCYLPALMPAQTSLPTNGGEAQPPQEPKISAALYRYVDAEAYANELLQLQESAPWWSMNGQYMRGASTVELDWLSSQELTPQIADAGLSTFSWQYTLPAGCYLLKANYQGQNRDIRFQVSAITAFVQSTAGRSLVWAHDTGTGLPLAEYDITYINGGQKTRADENGLVLPNVQRQSSILEEPGNIDMNPDIYLLRQGERTLVLAEKAPPNLAADSTNIWQYLRLNRQTYSAGDTLEFWGYMRRREGGDWEWSRVTVYICAQNAPGDPVTQAYAPLNNNIFHGSIELPRLLPGVYELQIWQSGQQLLSKSFLVNTEEIGAADSPTSINVNGNFEELSADKAVYTLNESYTLSLPGVGESNSGYLFFKQGLQEAVLESKASHQGVFGLDEAGGASWQAVSYAEGKYQVSQPMRLELDSSDYALNVLLETRDKANREQGESVVGIRVRDMAGAVPDKAGVLALVAPPGLDAGDILAELYTPSGAEGVAADGLTWQPGNVGNTPLFSVMELDKNGEAELAFPLPPGECRLYVWAVADAAFPLAGQAALTLASSGALEGGELGEPRPPEPNSAATPLYWATRYDISEGNSHYIRGGLLYFSSPERVQAMELLWQPLFSASGTVEQSLAKSYAGLLWQRHGYAGLDLPQTDSLSEMQSADGGIAALEGGPSDLLTSMLTASLVGDGLGAFDAAALARYLAAQAANGAPPAERVMATAGLAALDKPVLQEIKLMLAQEGQTPYNRAVLLWGLAQAGDMQVAKAAFYEFWDAYATDATSGQAYLEGGQGQNILLNRMGTLAAAACGEARTSFALLQYLRAQQEYDDFTAILVAGQLLPMLYADPATASLTYFLAPVAGDAPAMNGRAYTVEISAYNDTWREYTLPGNLLVDAVEGDMALTCLRLER